MPGKSISFAAANTSAPTFIVLFDEGFISVVSIEWDQIAGLHVEWI